MQSLSDYQRRVLLKNPNVEKVTTNHVIYHSHFKIKAVEKYLDGATPNDIFENADIDPRYFIKNYCRLCIKRWKKKYFEEGKASLTVSQQGKMATGRPKSINPDELNIEELRAIVEIQEELIIMLKKNRALARKKKVK